MALAAAMVLIWQVQAQLPGPVFTQLSGAKSRLVEMGVCTRGELKMRGVFVRYGYSEPVTETAQHNRFYGYQIVDS
jgi:hypothetical protein